MLFNFWGVLQLELESEEDADCGERFARQQQKNENTVDCVSAVAAADSSCARETADGGLMLLLLLLLGWDTACAT